MNKQIILTEEEAKLVMQCLDLATKHGGLNAAVAILPVAKSIESQLVEPAGPGEAVAGLQES